MKRLSVLVFTLLLAGTLSFAQAGGGTTGKADEKGKPAASTDSGKKGHKGGKKGHKGGKKGKKSSSDTTTAPK